jgi:hypothetical protein
MVVRRHRNILVKLTVALAGLYLASRLLLTQGEPQPAQPLEGAAHGEGSDFSPKVADAKDIVIDVPPAAGPKRDLNIAEPNLKELIEDKIVKEEKQPREKVLDEVQNNIENDGGDDANIEERKALDIPEPKMAVDHHKPTEEKIPESRKENVPEEKKEPNPDPGQVVEDQPALPPPMPPQGPGEMGKPVKVENPDKETKAKIDKGWKDNAFNG